jgi:CheY-like chemotaxis protein
MIRVLVVDDYLDHVETLVSTLKMYGCDARGCDKGTVALEIARQWTPHLIIYDGLLQGMHAWHFAHLLLSGEALPRRPYLVALTGFGSTVQRRLCEECGYDRYVTKPVELKSILDWVQAARERAEASAS